MNRYQSEIEKILKLQYAEQVYKIYKATGIERVNKVTVRIGHEYQLPPHDTIDEKVLLIHSTNICGETPRCNDCAINIFCKYYREKAMKRIKDNDLTVVDLFCGAGGFSLGFSQTGFKTVFAVDNQECCVETYRINHPEVDETRIVCSGIENVSVELDLAIEGIDVDIVIGGPPCQGFSMANRQKLINDPRNKLYKYFVETIAKVKPKFFVMENVEGMMKIKDEIIQDFELLETVYKVVPMRINAVNFGVPQNRKRVFFIGTRTGANVNDIIEQIIEVAGERPKTTLGDALYGMKKLSANTERNTTNKDSKTAGSRVEIKLNDMVNNYIDLINMDQNSKFVFNHKARYNNPRDIEIFSKLNPGDRSDDPKIAHIMPYSNRNDIFKDKYYRLREKKPCKTITAHMKYDCNMYIHPREARGLTAREAARIQSYPDNYYFCGSFTKTYMQVGNSVPPLVARTIAGVIRNYLQFGDREKKIESCEKLMNGSNIKFEQTSFLDVD